jgi:hypothetical protein
MEEAEGEIGEDVKLHRSDVHRQNN